jgi:benzodiazapine receptor
MRNVLRFVVAVGLPILVGGLSGFATSSGVRAGIRPWSSRPFNPPAWVFGPVWTVLYLMMGVAAWLVWRRGLDADGVRVGMAVFLIQLVLNGLWSILFFGMQQPGWALIEIIALWAAIGATIRLFWRVTPTAGALLLPYWAWVTFATVLNAALWWLNR